MLEIIKKKILLFLGNVKLDKTYNPKNAKSFLIRPMAGLGDSLVITPALRALRKSYPDAKIYVMVSHRNKRVFKDNPYIDGTIMYSTWSFIKLRNTIDVFVDTNMFIRMKTFILFRLLKPKYFITGAKRDTFGLSYKDFEIYKDFQPVNYNQHSKNVFISYLHPLNIEDDGKGYDLYISEDLVQKENAFWQKDKIKILLNLFGTTYRLNDEKIIKILNGIYQKYNCDIMVLWEEKTKKIVNNFVKKFPNAHIAHKTDKESLMALIKSSDIVISPDTGVVHIASVFNKSLLAFYLREGNFTINWAPLSNNTKIIKCDFNEIIENRKIFNFNEKEALESLESLINKI